MLDDRKTQILLSLIKTDHVLSVQDWVEEHQVSDKTIRKDLQVISDWLTKSGYLLKVIRRPGIGVYLEGDDFEKKLALQQIKQGSPPLSPYDTEERRNRIYLFLLQAEKPVTTEQLAINFYVSKSSLYTDLTEVEQRARKDGLSLIRRPNYGVEIQGLERRRRCAIQLVVERLIQGPWKLNLEGLFPSVPFSLIKGLLRIAEKEHIYSLSEESFQRIIIHIVVMLRRVKLKQIVQMDEQEMIDLEKGPEAKIVQELVQKLEHDFALRIPREERAYLTIYFAGAKLRNLNPHSTTSEVTFVEPAPEAMKQAKLLIQRVANYLEVPIQDDQTLQYSLALHLYSAINRLRHEVIFPNPLLQQIKETYRVMFETILAVLPNYEQELGVSFTEDEVGYLTLHFQAALERMENKEDQYSALLVCTTGIGTLQLLSSKIQKRFPMIQIADTIASYELEEALERHEPDMIISTIKLPQLTKVPHIVVSPILTQEEQDLVQALVFSSRQKAKRSYPTISSMLEAERIFLDVDLLDQSSVIHYLWKVMYDQGYVTFDYKETALHREELSSTAIGNQVAIPHGSVEESLRSGIALVRLKQSILWGTEEVRFVILFACESGEKHLMKDFFQELDQLLEDKHLLSQMLLADNAEDFLALIPDK
ncbi:BglG family transcription antiterminator [Risungbinella massiliensis]|uniref:BglG family transcription antiterminator n=1 Tax=Risungbinella massiliensis TaxID=1329796 RepID=UPI0005CBC767|nr:BglG family transcription antiterminator [Risungbinella massiliensis]